MNDYSEVKHGYSIIHNYFNERCRLESFSSLLNNCGDGIAEHVFAAFRGLSTLTQQNTFIACLSEHDDRENDHGRLSMWRSYGRGSASVAIVLKLSTVKVAPLQTFLSPVAYFEPDQVALEIQRVAANIEENRSFLQAVDRNLVFSSAFMMLTMAAISLKHVGFREEREWRLIHSPVNFSSGFMTTSLETIGGIPQFVCKIPLKNIPEVGISGISLPEIFDSLIIGPTVYPDPIANAFIRALTDAGVQDAGKRVVISRIPLRT